MIESAIVFLIAICIAGLLCQLATNFLPPGTPRTVAHLIIVLACLGLAATSHTKANILSPLSQVTR